LQEEHDIEPERPPSAAQWFVRKRIRSGELPWYEVLDFGPDRDAAYAVDRNLLNIGFERRTIDQMMASFVDEYDP
jgi:hypothetical protein